MGNIIYKEKFYSGEINEYNEEDILNKIRNINTKLYTIQNVHLKRCIGRPFSGKLYSGNEVDTIEYFIVYRDSKEILKLLGMEDLCEYDECKLDKFNQEIKEDIECEIYMILEYYGY